MTARRSVWKNRTKAFVLKIYSSEFPRISQSRTPDHDFHLTDYRQSKRSRKILEKKAEGKATEEKMEEHNKQEAGGDRPLRPFVQVLLAGEDIFFGPGKARLLEYIDKTGSMQEACAEMGLSYSKGSRMIKKAEKQLGFKLLERWTGGSGGGGSRVTPEGKDLLKKYKEVVRRVQEESENIFADVFDADR